MAAMNTIQGVESRYALYELDAQARGAIKRIWPTIAPQLDSAVDAILEATAKLPHVAEIVAQHRDLIKKLETAHLEALLSGELDEAVISNRAEKPSSRKPRSGSTPVFAAPPETSCCGRRWMRSRASTGFRPASLPKARN